VDWPGELAATVFLQGCPWRCPYCHNPHLLGTVADEGVATTTWPEVLAFLETRRNLLDGVVFTGGEPTVQAGLADGVREVRELGFKVGLHTGGPVPDRVREVLPMLDWVGFDLKAPFSEYERVTRVAGSGDAARASLNAVLDSGVPCEIRTTVHPALLDADALARMADALAEMGVERWVLQPFRVEGCGDESLGSQTLPPLRLSAALAAHSVAISIRD
jgi:pyruvate formate lyase activating enzyme